MARSFAAARFQAANVGAAERAVPVGAVTHPVMGARVMRGVVGVGGMSVEMSHGSLFQDQL